MYACGRFKASVGAIALVVSGWAFSTCAVAVPLQVDPGFDLLQTEEGLFDFGGALGQQAFEGLPFVSFDFGTGNKPTGSADAIIRRLAPATVANTGDSTTIDIEMVALSLVSVNPIAGLVGGTAGGRLTTGNVTDLGSTMTITFTGLEDGSFDSALYFSFDFIDQTTGQVLLQGIEIAFQQAGAPWSSTPPAGAVLLEGINHLLAGPGDGSNDFFSGIARHTGPGHVHVTDQAQVPVPAPLVLMCAGLGLVALGARRARRASAC
jgi:hypothetical protein